MSEQMPGAAPGRSARSPDRAILPSHAVRHRPAVDGRGPETSRSRVRRRRPPPCPRPPAPPPSLTPRPLAPDPLPSVDPPPSFRLEAAAHLTDGRLALLDEQDAMVASSGAAEMGG